MMPVPPPGNMRMSGPPVAPPDSPTLSAFPTSGGAPGAGASPHQSAAIPRLAFGITKSIDVLAKTLPPEVASDLEKAKALISGAVSKALQGGGGTPAAGGAMTPPNAGP